MLLDVMLNEILHLIITQPLIKIPQSDFISLTLLRFRIEKKLLRTCSSIHSINILQVGKLAYFVQYFVNRDIIFQRRCGISQHESRRMIFKL